MSGKRIIGWVILALTVLVALVPLVRGSADIPIAQHHLIHAALIAGGLLSALLLATPSRDIAVGHYGWLLLAVFSPFAAMLLMWPSEYAWYERHASGHILEHLGILGLGFTTGYAGQRYAAGIGWATGLSLLFMAVASAWGFGVAHSISPIVATSTVVQHIATSSEQATSGSPDVAHGGKLFTQNCAVCHGARGAGGEGPSLIGEKARKNFTQAQQWIIDPSPPMPKFYPAVLTRSDVRDVAAFIETL